MHLTVLNTIMLYTNMTASPYLQLYPALKSSFLSQITYWWVNRSVSFTCLFTILAMLGNV